MDNIIKYCPMCEEDVICDTECILKEYTPCKISNLVIFRCSQCNRDVDTEYLYKCL